MKYLIDKYSLVGYMISVVRYEKGHRAQNVSPCAPQLYRFTRRGSKNQMIGIIPLDLGRLIQYSIEIFYLNSSNQNKNLDLAIKRC